MANIKDHNGYFINGDQALAQLGFYVSPTGDVNGDGFDDYTVTAISAGYDGISQTGKVYVVFGSIAGWPENIELDQLDGTNGFMAKAEFKGESLGSKLDQPGDINGDGIDDLVFAKSDPADELEILSRVYVVFGKKTPWAAELNLQEIDGSNGFIINTQDIEATGSHLTKIIEDVNGDQQPELLIGVHDANERGGAYLLFGQGNNWPAEISLAVLDGQNGVRFDAINPSDGLGGQISSAGDINFDGFNDFMLSASSVDAEFINAGAVYVIFGDDKPWPASFDLSTLDGSNGFVLQGAPTIDHQGSFGTEHSSIGDFNQDGMDDVIIGSYRQGENGQAYVLFGSDSAWPVSLSVSELNGSNGFVIEGDGEVEGPTDFFGLFVSGIDDINGDQVPDIIIGAPYATVNGQTKAGKAHVIYGEDKTWPAQVFAADINGENGFTVSGKSLGDLSGKNVCSAGDVNGDGISDLLIGVPSSAPNDIAFAGSVYLIYGFKQ